MGIVDLISNALSAIGSFFGYQTEVQKEKNDPTIVANADAKQRAADADRINNQIANAEGTNAKNAAASQQQIRDEFSET